MEEASPVKREKAVSRCWSLGLAIALVAAACAMGSEAAGARDYKLGCSNNACVIVDDTGRISFFAAGTKKLSEGADQLRGPATGRIRPPLNIACSGDSRVVTDADSDVWIGPSQAGAPYGDPVARISVLRAR